MKETLSYEYADFANRFLDIRSVTGAEAMCICPFHEDSNPSFQFNMDKGMFVCFSCSQGGGIRALERKFGVDHRAVGVGLDVIYRKLAELNKDDVPELRMPEGELAQYSLPTDLWENRGFTPTTIAMFGLGYDMMRDAMTMPLRTVNGELLGVCKRYMDPDLRNRYRYPKGFHKSEHLFASHLVADLPETPSVALTEGAIDAMTLWQTGQPAMAIYGSSMSERQVQQLSLLGVRNVTLFFDNDKAGRAVTSRCIGWKQHSSTGKWERTGVDLRKRFQVRAVDWSDSPRGVKDANDLSPARIKRMLARARTIE